jgi:cell wall-associated NlpC family hydrolase
MNSKLKSIKWTTSSTNPSDHPGVMRGDLIFFYTSGSTIGHVAIYLGWDKIIHADRVNGSVTTSTIATLTDQNGRYRYRVAGVRRVYN